MKRTPINARPDWQRKIEEVGLAFHNTEEGLYWDETAYYEFSAHEIDVLEQATNELHELCLTAVQHVIDRGRFAELGIPPEVIPLVEYTWDTEPPSIYGRFDLSFDGKSPPKLLEYNADTPTALLEAGVVQWFWLEERFGNQDQFNSIHERLLAKWTELRPTIDGSPLYFSCARGSVEDAMTVGYLQDLAAQCGLGTSMIFIEDIGWNSKSHCFVDLDGNSIRNIFKLYPWEWMIREDFGEYLLSTCRDMHWMEPAWKMVLSSKGILPILWELNPGHPNLLESYFHEPAFMKAYARKPIFSREGANILLRSEDGSLVETGGSYGRESFIYQKLAPLPSFDNNHPVIGSWVIDGESAGIGIRETTSLITDNTSRFVPHLFS